LPEGLYIFFIFNGRLSNTILSESDGLIFTKISGLVDGWKGLLTWYIILQSLKGLCHGNQLVAKSAFFADQSSLSRCYSETDCIIASPISKD